MDVLRRRNALLCAEGADQGDGNGGRHSEDGGGDGGGDGGDGRQVDVTSDSPLIATLRDGRIVAADVVLKFQAGAFAGSPVGAAWVNVELTEMGMTVAPLATRGTPCPSSHRPAATVTDWPWPGVIACAVGSSTLTL